MSDYTLISKEEWDSEIVSIGEKWTILIGNEYFIISAVEGMAGTETYVFKGNKKGEIVDYMEIVGIKKWDHQEAITLLLEELAQ